MQISEYLLLSTITLTAAALVPQEASADTLWRIGVNDDHSATFREAKDEFDQDGAYQAVAVYDVTTQFDSAPSLPGRLGDYGNGTASRIEINFVLAQGYGDDQLLFNYGRYGSETDAIYLDGKLLATVSAAEGVGGRFRMPMPALDAGPHTLTFDYMGGGSNSGHAIDYFNLEDGSSTDGSPAGTQWRLGTREGQVPTPEGSLELGWTGDWQPNVACDVGGSCGSPDAPNIPQGLSSSTMKLADNPQSIDIDFTLAQSTVRGDLMLKLARYGSELDEVFVDGLRVGSVSAQEGRWIVAKYVLPRLTADEHTVTVRVVDGTGIDGRHYLDYLTLEDL